ncbi:ParA family partition ATPase [soil metagenome]
MKTITILQQKGGVGKTTLTLNLALFFAKEGAKVAICDADSQGSLTDIADMLEGVDLVSVEQVLAGQVDAQVLLIDTSPRNDIELPKLLAMTDYALLPVRPGYLDALAMKATATILKASSVPKSGIVLNQVQHRNSVTRDVLDMLAKFEIPILMTRVGQRVSYTRSAMTNGVFGSDDEKAQQEISLLAMEIHYHL